VRAVEALAEVETVKCQKICKGPVVGLEVGGELEWFRKMDSDKARRRLVKLLTTGEMKKALQKRRVGSRSGKKRA
jgi:(2Fe-2S) ferredoxin